MINSHAEESSCILIANAADEGGEGFEIVRQLAAFGLVS